MRTELTDAVMLAASQKALREHLATRPRTDPEREAARQSHLDRAAHFDGLSKKVHRPKTAAEIGRGPGAIAEQHEQGVIVANSVSQSLRHRNMADYQRMIARSLEVPATEAWERTRAELQGRVDFYSEKVNGK